MEKWRYIKFYYIVHDYILILQTICKSFILISFCYQKLETVTSCKQTSDVKELFNPTWAGLFWKSQWY